MGSAEEVWEYYLTQKMGWSNWYHVSLWAYGTIVSRVVIHLNRSLGNSS